ncbi:hypothetical protein D7V64_08785 [Acinetobacter cumulans]|uniref:PepSY domain-containing protein n=1 Tax=Acinetobacter cumulans TaxID=2136182 RepID=A0A3A8GFY2_9GAMM|nr:hypothetical protein [Acinetobacter cumulans]RKG52671.1 hypothetical protein D7V64_08785 [Acinetobacter cumulans]
MHKTWALITCIFLTVPTMSWAETTNSIQTPEHQNLTLGDKFEDMQNRMKASPIKVTSYTLVDATKPNTLAVDYTYEIENFRYNITIVDGYVFKIDVENMDK